MNEPTAPDLDEGTADRLLGGAVDGATAPPGWERVAALLRAAAAAEHAPPEGPSPELLAALVEAAERGPAVARRRIGAAVGVGLVVVLSGTGVAAAGGHLPDPVQDVVHDVVGAVGLEVPVGDPGPPNSGGSQDGPGHGRSDEAPGRPDDPGQPTQSGEPGRSEEAPGQPEDPGSPSEDAPGQDDETGRPDDPGQPGPPPSHGPNPTLPAQAEGNRGQG